jgi:hypothetical protein
MNSLDESTCWRQEMRDLKRRITKLEQDAGHEMVFITYLGNPEPMSLTVGGRQIDRLPGESWTAFKSRVDDGWADEPFAIGPMARGAND